MFIVTVQAPLGSASRIFPGKRRITPSTKAWIAARAFDVAM